MAFRTLRHSAFFLLFAVLTTSAIAQASDKIVTGVQANMIIALKGLPQFAPAVELNKRVDLRFESTMFKRTADGSWTVEGTLVRCTEEGPQQGPRDPQGVPLALKLRCADVLYEFDLPSVKVFGTSPASNGKILVGGIAWVGSAPAPATPPPAPAPAPAAAPTPAPAPTAQALTDFTGRWDSSFGPMELVVRDAEIYGTYPSDKGRVVLRQDGRKLVGVWIEDSSTQHCGDQKDGSPYWGSLAFSFNDDLTAFEGQWSYCTNPLGGTWNGTRLAPESLPAAVTSQNCTLAEDIASMEYVAIGGSPVTFSKTADGTWLQTVVSGAQVSWQEAGCENDTISLARIEPNSGLELRAKLNLKDKGIQLFNTEGSYTQYSITKTEAGPPVNVVGDVAGSGQAPAVPAAPVTATSQTRGAFVGAVLDQFIKPLSQGSFCWRDSYGRGTGDPLAVCPAGQDQSGALCYQPCKEGFSGAGPICWSQCPQGYTDDGVTCRKDPIIQGKTSYPRGDGTPMTCGPGKVYQAGLCYSECDAGWSATVTECYQDCPSGFRDDGLYCGKQSISSCPAGWQDIGVSCKKPSRDRGVGTGVDSCPQGSERNGALCYPNCKAGYAGSGPRCWSVCPDGFVDDGATCRKPGDIQGKNSYARGAGTSLACQEGLQQSGALCYSQCEDGAEGIGPVCWGRCPSSMPFRCGAGCAVTENDCIVAVRNMFLSGVKMGADVAEAAFTGGAPEVLSGIVPTDEESALECATEVGEAGVGQLLPGLGDLPESFTGMSAVASTGVRAQVVDMLDKLAGELTTTLAPTGAHVLAAFVGHLEEPAREGLITEIALAAEGEQIHPLDIISNVPCIGYGITDFVGSFSYYQCSRFPDEISEPSPVQIEDVRPTEQKPITLTTGLNITFDALNVEPSGIEVQMRAKDTVDEEVVREFLGSSYTPERAQKILERFKSGKPFDLKAIAEGVAIEVASATYGGNCGATQGNVTGALAAACNGRASCSYTIDFRVLGDPVPMCAKDFVAKWRCSSGAQERTQTVAAEAGSGDKTIALGCS